MPRAVWWIALVVASLVFSPSLTDQFLSYDDDWLILENSLLHADGAQALPAILWDFGVETRNELGSEYLPVRDVLVWCELRVFGDSALAMRVTSLAMYLVALYFLGRVLRAIYSDNEWVAFGAWLLFAVHPIHAESVCWLASQKDLLNLLFSCMALWLYLTSAGRRSWGVPLLVLLACFSKSIGVVLPALLWLCGERLWHSSARSEASRRQVVPILVASTVAAGLALGVHYAVGQRVEMMTAPFGGSRFVALLTMGEVFFRYLAMSFFPVGLSVVYEQVPASADSPMSWAILALAILAVVGATWLYVSQRQRAKDVWFACGWFVIPLLPVSQVLVPLPNIITDRYLLLSVLGPCVGLGWAASELGARIAWPRGSGVLGTGLAAIKPMAALGVVACFFAALASERSWLFGDAERLFTDAVSKTEFRAVPRYQLGLALEKRGALGDAERTYRETLALAEQSTTHCKALNNLTYLLTTQGREKEALSVLEQQQEHCREDPRSMNNLAELLARAGRDTEARRAFATLFQRFPRYEKARRNFERHYGPL